MVMESVAETRLRQLPVPGTRVGHLVLNGFLIATANIFGSSLAAARFLSTQGGEGIAAYYMIFAIISIPAWAVYARFIDRGSRALLMQRYLLVMVVLTTSLIAASGHGGLVADYALYVGISVLELLLFSLYMVMLTDYLTAREMSRFATRITVSLSAGSMTGGTLAGLLADHFEPFWLLFGMPVLLLVSLGHLAWLSRRWPPAGEWTAVGEASVLESLRGIGRILRGVWIAVLLSAAVFLNIATQCVSEYMVFGIYAESYPDEQSLAAFFGLMSGALNLAAVLIGLGLTEPLMKRLGVARMNLFFPVSLGISFVAMMVNPVLAVAMFAHVVYDGFSNNVDAPVMAVNYNAVPQRFVGQVRVFNDSLIYPVALAASGFVILLVEHAAGAFGVGMLGILMSLAFVGVGWALGRNYVRGLIGILKEGSVNLDRAGFMTHEAPKVALRHRDELLAMLNGADQTSADIALRIVANADLAPFMDAVTLRLERMDDSAVTILARAGVRHAPALLARWPTAGPLLRERIAEYLAAVGHALPADAGQTGVMEALSLAASLGQEGAGASRLLTLASSSVAAARALIPVAATRADGRFMPLLVAIAQHHPTLRDRALQILSVVPLGTSAVASIPADLVKSAIESGEPDRMTIGYRLAAHAGWPSDRIVRGLSDPDVFVRRAAVQALKGRGDSIPALRSLLGSENPRARLAAIEALGQAEATDILFDYLRDEAFPRIAAYRDWRHSLPISDESWVQVARLAMAESDRAAIDEVLATLEALGHDQAVRYIRRFISASDERMRARAAEAISAFDERKLVTPLLPLLDERSGLRSKRLPLESVIAKMQTSASPWLRRAAALAKPAKPKESTMSGTEESLLDRLLFLRKVPIFESCSLDDLYAIHQVMTRVDFVDGELIMEDGAQGEELFVLLDGAAKVGRRTPSGFTEYTRLSQGSTFGEMALFGDGIRTADVIAVGPVACLVLDRSHFEDLIRQQPGILIQICRLLGNRLTAANRGSDALRAKPRA